MSHIGSVFLGDFGQRHRILSSTPPSSPPPDDPQASFNPMDATLDTLDDISATASPTDLSAAPTPSLDALAELPPAAETSAALNAPPPARTTTAADGDRKPPPPPLHIDPQLALELRLRWLEALIVGVPGAFQSAERKVRARPPATKARAGTVDAGGGARRRAGGVGLGLGGPEDLLPPGDTLMRRASDVQRKLGTLADVHDGLRKFIAQYDAHAELLTPAFALSGTLPSAAAAGYESMAPEELDAFLADMEPDVRAADRDMREIEALEAKGVTGAGKLADYKALEPRLEALITAHEEDVELAASLEQRIAALVDRHSTHVDALSELFVAWDDLLTDTEDKVTRLERNRQERQRLGYE